MQAKDPEATISDKGLCLFYFKSLFHLRYWFLGLNAGTATYLTFLNQAWVAFAEYTTLVRVGNFIYNLTDLSQKG